jgi:hypothetical protein
MKNNRWLQIFSLGAASLSLSAGLANAQPDVASAKGIFIEGRENKPGGKPGVQFDVLLMNGKQEKPVSSRYDFHDGDRMKFRIEANQDLYFYVINRTFNGDPSQYASKGIDRVKNEDSQKPPSGPTYKLLYPVRNEDNKVHPGKAITIPGGSETFTMDERPGVEKIYVVVSQKPLNIRNLFNVETGDIKRDNRNDSRDDVLNQLNADLTQYASNGNTAFADKGIGRSDSYGIVREADKPAQFEVTLRHLPK